MGRQPDTPANQDFTFRITRAPEQNTGTPVEHWPCHKVFDAQGPSVGQHRVTGTTAVVEIRTLLPGA